MINFLENNSDVVIIDSRNSSDITHLEFKLDESTIIDQPLNIELVVLDNGSYRTMDNFIFKVDGSTTSSRIINESDRNKTFSVAIGTSGVTNISEFNIRLYNDDNSYLSSTVYTSLYGVSRLEFLLQPAVRSQHVVKSLTLRGDILFDSPEWKDDFNRCIEFEVYTSNDFYSDPAEATWYRSNSKNLLGAHPVDKPINPKRIVYGMKIVLKKKKYYPYVRVALQDLMVGL